MEQTTEPTFDNSLRSQRETGREQNGGAAGLTPEEFDRAVRRDSRRYDGGMTIF